MVLKSTRGTIPWMRKNTIITKDSKSKKKWNPIIKSPISISSFHLKTKRDLSNDTLLIFYLYWSNKKEYVKRTKPFTVISQKEIKLWADIFSKRIKLTFPFNNPFSIFFLRLFTFISIIFAIKWPCYVIEQGKCILGLDRKFATLVKLIFS